MNIQLRIGEYSFHIVGSGSYTKNKYVDISFSHKFHLKKSKNKQIGHIDML